MKKNNQKTPKQKLVWSIVIWIFAFMISFGGFLGQSDVALFCEKEIICWEGTPPDNGAKPWYFLLSSLLLAVFSASALLIGIIIGGREK